MYLALHAMPPAEIIELAGFGHDNGYFPIARQRITQARFAGVRRIDGKENLMHDAAVIDPGDAITDLNLDALRRKGHIRRIYPQLSCYRRRRRH